LLTLVPGELGGSESATRALLRALARGGTLPYRVYLPPAAPDGGEGLPSQVVGAYHRAHTIPGRLAAMSAAAARPGPIRRAFAGAELVHYPLTIRIPPLAVPSVVTLHDLQHLDLPALFSRAERAFRLLAYHRSVRGASLVVCPSAFVAGRAVAALGLDPDRVKVIHHGVDHARFSPGQEPREPFLLYPARRWPHKNHARLFEAFALLRAAAAPSEDASGPAGPALAAVSIDRERTTLAISVGGFCHFTRVIEWGDGNIDATVARGVHVTPAEAATLWRELPLAERQGDVASETSAAVRSLVAHELQALVRELHASLRFYLSQPNPIPIGVLLLSGSLVEVAGVVDYLRAGLELELAVLDPFARVRMGKNVERPGCASELSVAIGLGIED